MEKGKTSDILKSPKHPYTKILFESLPPDHPSHRKDLTAIPEIEREDIEGGCVFYHRCPVANEICRKEPEMKKFQNREVYCHFA